MIIYASLTIAASAATSSTTASYKPSTSGPRSTGRASRTPKRFGTQSTRLEAVDDSLGPLGPLGDNSTIAIQPEETFEETSREQQLPIRTSITHTTIPQSSLRTPRDSADIEEVEDEEESSRPRVPPPVQPPPSDVPSRQTQRSVSVVEAAKPTFHISVGDPHKVGGATSVHTEYQVYTKVCPGFSYRAIKRAHYDLCRLPRKPTETPSSLFLAVSEIFYGSTNSCITTIPESLCLHHLRNKRSAASTQILSNREDNRWNACSTRLLPIPLSNTMPI